MRFNHLSNFSLVFVDRLVYKLSIFVDMKKLYRSRIDWWVWAFVGFTLFIIFAMAISVSWWFSLFYGAALTALMIALLFGVWYVIDGETLIVYMFFRPMRLPIRKIKSVRFCRGYTSSAALSFTRVSIKFVDRSVLKSSLPLEISPKNREKFVQDLVMTNPRIEILDKP